MTVIREFSNSGVTNSKSVKEQKTRSMRPTLKGLPENNLGSVTTAMRLSGTIVYVNLYLVHLFSSFLA